MFLQTAQIKCKPLKAKIHLWVLNRRKNRLRQALWEKGMLIRTLVPVHLTSSKQIINKDKIFRNYELTLKILLISFRPLREAFQFL